MRLPGERPRHEPRAGHDGAVLHTRPGGLHDDVPPVWRALLEQLLEAACLVDPVSMTIAAANAAADQLLAGPGRSLTGQPVMNVAFTPEDQFFWEEAARGQAVELHSDTLVPGADGLPRHVERRVHRLQLEGEPSLYLLTLLDQSARHAAEDELEARMAELRATLESTADGILVVDPEGRIRCFNHRFALLWDLPEDLLSNRDDGCIHRWMQAQMADRGSYLRRLGELQADPQRSGTDVLQLGGGRVLERVTLPQGNRSRAIGRVYSFRDITQRLQDEKRLRLAAKVFESSLDAVFVVDAQGRVATANPAFERMAGLSADALQGMELAELLIDADTSASALSWPQRLARCDRWEGELLQRTGTVGGRPVHASITRVDGTRGATADFVIVLKDLSEREADRRRIETLAHTDTLTGLPNRQGLAQRVSFEIALSQREQAGFALLFIGMDRFKHVNESLGHVMGDRVLVEAARRIKASLRQVDSVARLGGDEFVVLLHKADAHGAETTAQRVQAALAEPIELDGVTFTVTCSVGIAMFPTDGDNLDTLLTNADTAMIGVKARGRSGVRFYQPKMNVDLLARMKVDHAMRQALARGDFQLHYQPQVALANGEIRGAEALIRWRDPEMGEMSPGRFIPVAEETGFIVAIGQWVLEQAVRQCADWLARGLRVPVSVNVSALQFQQPDFDRRVAATLRAARLPAGMLELELTESILVGDAKEMTERLQGLRNLGVRLAIDDFGTGYSSLGYLKRFPIDRLKIDRSFIDQLPDDESDAVITRAVIHLARALNLEVIAEGVETEAQRRFLEEAGCDEFQGWLFAKAVAPAELERLLKPASAACA